MFYEKWWILSYHTKQYKTAIKNDLENERFSQKLYLIFKGKTCIDRKEGNSRE